jgi:hypothetical protein
MWLRVGFWVRVVADSVIWAERDEREEKEDIDD